MTEDNFTVKDPSKLARVELLINRFPGWWADVVFEMNLDILAKLGQDPRDIKYAGLHVASFIKTTEVLDDNDPDFNPICNALAAQLHPTMDFRGIDDTLVRDASRMLEAHLLDDVIDDRVRPFDGWLDDRIDDLD